MGVLGVIMAVLSPPGDDSAQFKKGEKRPFPAADILRAIAFESTLVLIAGADLLAGHPVTDTDRARLALACSRIQAALTAGGIRHE